QSSVSMHSWNPAWRNLMVLTSIGDREACLLPKPKEKSVTIKDWPTKSRRLVGERSPYFCTIAAHSASRFGISSAREQGSGGPTCIPKASAIAGHTFGQAKTSPLVILKISL